MHVLPWITIFGSWVRQFANNFHKWRGHKWKSLAGKLHHNVLFHFLHAICDLNTQFHWKQISIADFAIAKDGLFWLGIVMSLQLICEGTLKLDTGIVMSYSSIALAHAN